jgi:hypothetical protein
MRYGGAAEAVARVCLSQGSRASLLGRPFWLRRPVRFHSRRLCSCCQLRSLTTVLLSLVMRTSILRFVQAVATGSPMVLPLLRVDFDPAPSHICYLLQSLGRVQAADVHFGPPCCYGRHWVRVELSTILIKYAFKISIQFWSRRDNLYIVPRTGVADTCQTHYGQTGVVPLA